jgi:hypothetical protein
MRAGLLLGFELRRRVPDMVDLAVFFSTRQSLWQCHECSESRDEHKTIRESGGRVPFAGVLDHDYDAFALVPAQSCAGPRGWSPPQ